MFSFCLCHCSAITKKKLFNTFLMADIKIATAREKGWIEEEEKRDKRKERKKPLPTI